uniref:Uncharacterized protein n=1 Tax=uncultured marine virus TaxID=186617 RepID=A0A0F7L5J0_9VIRU|nr:hypothetical protein [uncultured marine virus]
MSLSKRQFSFVNLIKPFSWVFQLVRHMFDYLNTIYPEGYTTTKLLIRYHSKPNSTE